MTAKALLEGEKIADAIGKIPGRSFTILDFAQVIRKLYPQDWKRMVEWFGGFGEKRRYTVSTYLSNRLDLYFHKPYFLLRPLVH